MAKSGSSFPVVDELPSGKEGSLILPEALDSPYVLTRARRSLLTRNSLAMVPCVEMEGGSSPMVEVVPRDLFSAPPRARSALALARRLRRMKMENHKKVELIQDLPNMPTEIWEKICKLLTIPNQVRFSTVCKTWLSANISKKACHWIPDAPWLVSFDSTHAEFQAVSNTDKQAYKIYKPFNFLLGASIEGSSKGWLVLRSEYKLFIINLFSKLHLDLPPITAVSFSQCSKGGACFQINFPSAFAISMCPNMNPTSVAFVTYNGHLGWCKVGDTAWKAQHHTSDWSYANVAFHNEKLYAVDRGGEKVNIFKYDQGVLVQVGSVESTKSSEHFPSAGPIQERVYLVECGGKVLVVRRITDDTKFCRATVNFVISVVDENSSTPQLVKVQCLDDHVLFVAKSSIECLDAKHCPEFQRGCVYFTCYATGNYLIPELGQFSIANGTILWSNPLMNTSMERPIWVQPRFPFDCDCEECTYAPWITPERMTRRQVLKVGQRKNKPWG